MKNRNIFANVWAQRGLILAVLLVIMLIGNRSFFSLGNLRTILMSIAIYGIMCCGMLLAMLTGGIDLAMGSTAAFTSVICLWYYNGHGMTDGAFAVGLVLAVLAAIAVGILHGVCDAYLMLPSFVVTLATGKLLYGLASAILKGSFIHLTNTEGFFYRIANSRLFGIPMPIVIFVAVAVIVGLILAFTVFGRRVYAVGANRAAAELVGINSRVFRVGCYVICSLTACVGGIVLTSMNYVTSATTAQGYEMMIMLALVVGGADIMGGYGDIAGAVFGALLAGIVENMIVMLNINTNYSQAVQGVIIVLAVAFNVYNNRKSAGLTRPRKKKPSLTAKKEV
ncbi:MAG: ABC transporter permease [Oscillospiraceae bacterium]|jgi:ribose/xylose/arabinose/galactoside ABC-type transport system permease subunit|nr:ABC transporter permease [Oscillospiraceae bacterium]